MHVVIVARTDDEVDYIYNYTLRLRVYNISLTIHAPCPIRPGFKVVPGKYYTEASDDRERLEIPEQCSVQRTASKLYASGNGEYIVNLQLL